MDGTTTEVFLRGIINSVPFAVLAVDDDWRIEFANRWAIGFVYPSGNPYYRIRGGEAFNCIHDHEHPSGCGCAAHCQCCVVRNLVHEAIVSGNVMRKRTILEMRRDGAVIEVPILVTANRICVDQRILCLLLLEEGNEI